MNYGPLARIALRYLVGAAFMGSAQIGEQLATDPDVVMIVSAGIGFAVEGLYLAAKRLGWRT